MFYTHETIDRIKLISLFILFLEASLLYLGVTLPLVRIKHFWIFKEEQSVVDILVIFYQNNEFILFLIISIMGFILPFIKLLFRAFQLDGKVFNIIGKFASLDIFLIALLIFVGKSISFIDVNLSPGFYFLCGGIIMGLLKIDKIIRRHFSDESLSNKEIE